MDVKVPQRLDPQEILKLLVALRRALKARQRKSKAPHPSPLPGGRGSRPRCLAIYIDLKDRVDYGFGRNLSRRRTSTASPDQSPLPLGGPTFREG